MSQDYNSLTMILYFSNIDGFFPPLNALKNMSPRYLMKNMQLSLLDCASYFHYV